MGRINVKCFESVTPRTCQKPALRIDRTLAESPVVVCGIRIESPATTPVKSEVAAGGTERATVLLDWTAKVTATVLRVRVLSVLKVGLVPPVQVKR
jgi:hypothetical protein